MISQDFVYEVENKSTEVKIDTLRKPNEDFRKIIQKERKRLISIEKPWNWNEKRKKNKN